MTALLDALSTAALPGLTAPPRASLGVVVLHTTPAGLLPLVQCLKQDLQCEVLLDVTAVDWPERTPRFDVVLHLLSMARKARLRIKLQVPEAAPRVPSLTGLYGSAAFLERECHDMYGIVFEGNADLRPILLYEGFVGHPLRKDYPKQQAQPLVPYRP